MPALAVIKNPDVFPNGRFCLHPGFKALAMDPFIFRAAPEALNRGIAVTMAFSRHGSYQAVFLKHAANAYPSKSWGSVQTRGGSALPF